jgi:hypothetical protein
MSERWQRIHERPRKTAKFSHMETSGRGSRQVRSPLTGRLDDVVYLTKAA